MAKTKITELYDRYSKYSEKASDGVRTLAVAGIAAVWLFTGTGGGGLGDLATAPSLLLWSGLAFAIALALDVLHYFLAALLYRGTAKWAEKSMTKRHGGTSADDAIDVRPWLPAVPFWLFVAKTLALFIGWVLFASAVFAAL